MCKKRKADCRKSKETKGKGFKLMIEDLQMGSFVRNKSLSFKNKA